MHFVPAAPRVYTVGHDNDIYISDYGRIELLPNEQVTFTSPGGEYNITRKDWGFYATPSTNKDTSLRPCLAISKQGKCYILMEERGKEMFMEAYCEKEGMRIVCRLDDASALLHMRSL